MNFVCLNRRSALGLGAAAAVSLVDPARALPVNPPVVVELFTSQGCSSCPPADAFMGELVGKPNVIGLSLNVDYWDYIGWRDTLASPANTKRQYDYAKKRGDNRVYTPQMVINGYRHVVGSDRPAVLRIIEEESHRTARSVVELSIANFGGQMSVSVGPAPNDIMRKESALLLITLLPVVTVEIEKGENSGRQVSYYNVVRRIMPIGMWQGDASSVRLPTENLLSDPLEGCVCLLQMAQSGHVIGATTWGIRPRQS
jgi:hypothetical protein